MTNCFWTLSRILKYKPFLPLSVGVYFSTGCFSRINEIEEYVKNFIAHINMIKIVIFSILFIHISISLEYLK